MTALQNIGLHSGFLSSAAQYPDRDALAIGERIWSYKEAEEITRRWANALLQSCANRPNRIGILAYRCEVSYLATLACLFSGAAFVPLNPNFPLSRTRSMLEEAKLDAIFVDSKGASQIGELLEKIKVPVVLSPEAAAPLSAPESGLTWIGPQALRNAKPLHQVVEVQADSLAYLLFTSGSTGQPKGVPITHSNIIHFLRVMGERYKLTPEDRLTQTFEQTFDPSVFDLFMAWWNGACACSIQAIELLSPFQFVREKKITWWNSVPSIPALLQRKNLLSANSLSNLRWSIFGGEALPRSIAEAWQRAAPSSIVENLYGPTETTVACSAYRWEPFTSARECVGGLVPIGKVFPGLEHVVVDESLQVVPPGSAGELCIAGPQVFPGYWNDATRTAERTFTGLGHGARFYRTGDKVCLLDTGNYAFLGRTDQQCKINGHRVELGEIESALLKEPQVTQAAALLAPSEDGVARGIVAFVSGSPIDGKILTQMLRSQLPSYMVPKAIHCLETLPQTANGKIDREELRRILASGIARESR